MNQAKPKPTIEEISILMIVPQKPARATLERVTEIAMTYSAQVQVFCPVVVPPVPHTGMTPSVPAATADQGAAREEARRIATSTLGFLNERNVDAHIETGTCASITEGIINSVRRLKPDLLVIPRPAPSGLLERAFSIRLEEIWTKLNGPTWLLGGGAEGRHNLVGLLDFDKRGRDRGDENQRVAMEAARLAQSRRSVAHLVACARPPLALASGAGSFAPEDMTSVPEHKDNVMVHRLHAIASECGIAESHVHIYHGSEADVLQQMLGPLEIGLVVVSGRPQRRLGGLWKHHLASDLTELDCELLVLGENDVRNN